MASLPPPMAPSTVPPPPAAAAGGGPASISSLSENEKRWMVVGFCLHKVLSPALRKYIALKIQDHYALHKTSYNIHSQAHPGFLKKDNNVGFQFNYESVNNNRSKKAYDYKVVSAIDFAKLYLRPEMAKFTGFDSTCDASASLGILERSSAFSTAVQESARDVRSTVRNEWGHCNFKNWEKIKFNDCIQKIDTLIRKLGLSLADETKLVVDLKDWENRGVQLCMGSVVDADLLNLISVEVANLRAEVQTAKESNEEEFEKVSNELCRMSGLLVECREQVSQNTAKLEELSSSVGDLNSTMESLHLGEENLTRKMADVTESLNKLTQRVEVVEGEQEKIKEQVGTPEAKIAARGYRKPRTLKDTLVHSSPKEDSTQVRGCSKCGSKRCMVCNFLKTGREFHSTVTNEEYVINLDLDCNSDFVVYLITCSMCSKQYIGSTINSFRTRFNNHKSRLK
ncbi:uncharacterized protein LOC116618829, partial [Nematostella vectensis]|uniref:uncharacterized protein LOC116618829 n=1 Tax=Nematostella vectensis TaxID=45351 RepID=UPI0020771F9B